MTTTATNLISRTEMACRLGISESHLRNLAYRKEGPPVIKIGRRVRYDTAAVDAWLAERPAAR